MHIEFEKPLINGVGVLFFFQKTQSARSQNHHLNEKRYADSFTVEKKVFLFAARCYA